MNDDYHTLNILLSDIEVGPTLQQGIVERLVLELMGSVQHHGLIIPVEVMPGTVKRWALIDGLHRFEVAKRLKWETVPSRIRDKPLGDGERIEFQLMVNTIRCEVSVLRQALAVRDLMQATERTASQIAERLGWTKSRMTKTLRLLELSPEIQQWIDEERLAPSTAYELTLLDNPAAQLELAKKTVDDQLPREAVIDLVKELSSLSSASEPVAAIAPCACADRTGNAVSEKQIVRRFTTTVAGLELRISGPALTPESLIASLAGVLSRAKKLRSRGVDAEAFFRSLRERSKPVPADAGRI